jgi:hypothetical protein
VGRILNLKTHRIVTVVLGLLVLGAVTAGIAVAAGLVAQPEPVAAPKPLVLPTALAEHFAVLDESGVGSADVASVGSPTVSSATVSALTASSGGINAQFGGSVSLAKEATYGQSQHVWLVPGSTGLCLHDLETGEGTCAPTADAIAGTLTLDVGGNERGIIGGGTIYGVAPNGNSVIVVHDANGSTEDVSVEHNVYIISHPGAVSVELIDGAGQTQSVTLPR